jgi:hypothetical protein
MRTKAAFWGMLAVIGFIELAFLLPPIPRVKTQASRVSGVNVVRSVSMTLTNTNALPSAQPGIGK